MVEIGLKLSASVLLTVRTRQGSRSFQKTNIAASESVIQITDNSFREPIFASCIP